MQQVIEVMFKNHSHISNRVFKNIILIEVHTEDSQILSVQLECSHTHTCITTAQIKRRNVTGVAETVPGLLPVEDHCFQHHKKPFL